MNQCCGAPAERFSVFGFFLTDIAISHSAYEVQIGELSGNLVIGAENGITVDLAAAGLNGVHKAYEFP